MVQVLYLKRLLQHNFSNRYQFLEVKHFLHLLFKASLAYNDLLSYYKSNHLEPIRNASKIKWVYLKNNPFQLDALAYKGYDDPKELMNFIKQYIDRDKLYNRALIKKIQMFYDALSWDMPIDKQNSIERFF